QAAGRRADQPDLREGREEIAMSYAFYPGCVSRGGCPELYPSAVTVAARLGLELEELTDVGCNGAGVLSREVSDPINARTFAKAEQRGLPTVMTICSTCTGVMGQANIKFREDPAYRARTKREAMTAAGHANRATVGLKHLARILYEETGLGRLNAAVRRPARVFAVRPLPQLIGLGLGFNPDELQLKRHIVPTRSVAEKVQLLT